MAMLDSLWNSITTALPAFKTEWPTVITLILGALVVGWVVGRFMYGQSIASQRSQIEALQERIRLRDDQLALTKSDLDAAKAKPEDASKIIDELRERLTALQPYGLAKEAEQRMIEVLRKKPSTVRINIVLEATDADPLYRQVIACFRAAGWNLVDDGQVWNLTDAPDSGVAILTWDGVPADDVATIKTALGVGGLDAQVRSNDPNSTPQANPQIVFSSRDPNYQPAARWG